MNSNPFRNGCSAGNAAPSPRENEKEPRRGRGDSRERWPKVPDNFQSQPTTTPKMGYYDARRRRRRTHDPRLQ